MMMEMFTICRKKKSDAWIKACIQQTNNASSLIEQGIIVPINVPFAHRSAEQYSSENCAAPGWSLEGLSGTIAQRNILPDQRGNPCGPYPPLSFLAPRTPFPSLLPLPSTKGTGGPSRVYAYMPRPARDVSLNYWTAQGSSADLETGLCARQRLSPASQPLNSAE